MKKIFLCQSPYNFFKTTYSIKKLVTEARKRNLKSLILLERSSLSGALEFYYECKKNSIKPCICLEAYLEGRPYWFFPLNEKGFRTLFGISNKLVYHMNESISIETFNIDSNIIFYEKSSGNPTIPPKDMFKWNEMFRNQFKGVLTNYVIINKIVMAEESTIEFLAQMGSLKEIEYCASLDDIIWQDDDFISNLNLEITTKPVELPWITKYQNWDFFRSLCIKGLKARFKSPTVPLRYYERLAKELEVVKERHFESYFLVFYDLVQYCFNEGILIGPGRGSAAGSLISYCLYITNIDPIKHKLIFERFLNPMRKDLPDIDLDIEDVNRDKVMEYLYERYGADRIANITTFSTFRLKGAFREIGKILGLNNVQIKDVSNCIPSTYFSMSLKEALDVSNALLQKYSTDEKIKLALEVADKLRDIPRHSSIHAAGVILTHEKMAKMLPLYLNKNQIPITQWKMEEIEKWGVPKLDLLGLTNLTIIKNSLVCIYLNRHKLLTMDSLSKYDRKVFSLLAKGKTYGIFQLESKGMQKVLTKIKPKSIEEIGLVSALYRPGANKHIDECARNKHNSLQIKKIHPIIDEILAPTFGVLVYQEQIMEIIVKYAGMSYSEADIIRRLISKKTGANVDNIQRSFINSCSKKGYDVTITNQIWADIIRFAGYGFNKSHAIAYATISYWMAYLKVNYPLEFFTSLLSSFKMDLYKTLVFIADARVEFGIIVNGPNINLSGLDYSVFGNNILAPLILIRGVGENTIYKIIKDRHENGPYKTYQNTIKRLVKMGISADTILNMIKAGCLEGFSENTTTQIYNLNKVLQYIKLSNNANISEPNIVSTKDSLIDISKWEKEALGFNITRSVIQLLEQLEKETEIRKFFMIKNIPNIEFMIIVYVENIINTKTKRGKNMLILQLNDAIDTKTIYIFKEDLIKYINGNLKIGMFCKMCIRYENRTSNEDFFNLIQIVKIYNI